MNASAKCVIWIKLVDDLDEVVVAITLVEEEGKIDCSDNLELLSEVFVLLLLPSKSAAEFSFPVLRFSLMCTAPTAITIAAAAAVIAVKMLFFTFACLTFVLL